MDPYITTFTGKRFYPLQPVADDICIEDIAHHLALVSRFGGATRAPYSVAQHSFHVAQLCEPHDRLWALLHDASEAYIADIVRPLKHSAAFAAYRGIEAQLQACIFQRFGLTGPMPEAVTVADNLMLHAEAQDLLPYPPAWAYQSPRSPFPVGPWSAQQAETVFLNRFAELTGGRS